MLEFSKLIQMINKNLEKGGYLQEKFIPYLERYFSLYGKVDFDDIECWVSIGYNGNNHQGYYTYTEKWLTLNGKQILLISSSYDEEEKENLKERYGG